MKNFGNNAWLGIMNIIYSIHSNECTEIMCERFLKQVSWLVPYDQAMFFIPQEDDAIKIISSANLNDEYLRLYEENYKRYDYASGLKIGGNSIVYRESDIIESKVWINSAFYTQFCKPNHILYNLHTVLCYGNQYVGEIILCRDDNTINATDFRENAEFIMNLLKEHLALGLYRLTGKKKMEELTVAQHGMEEHTFMETAEDVWEKRDPIIYCAQRYGLTRRESEILRELVVDMPMLEICDKLVITPNTLKKHTANIYRKMEVNSKVRLIQKVNEF